MNEASCKRVFRIPGMLVFHYGVVGIIFLMANN